MVPDIIIRLVFMQNYVILKCKSMITVILCTDIQIQDNFFWYKNGNSIKLA